MEEKGAKTASAGPSEGRLLQLKRSRENRASAGNTEKKLTLKKEVLPVT